VAARLSALLPRRTQPDSSPSPFGDSGRMATAAHAVTSIAERPDHDSALARPDRVAGHDCVRDFPGAARSVTAATFLRDHDEVDLVPAPADQRRRCSTHLDARGQRL